MRKITLLLLFTSFLTANAQVFDFNNTNDGWTVLNSLTSINNATYMTLTTIDGDGNLKNPSFGITTAGVDTTTKTYAGITIRNNSANHGPSYLRVSYPKIGGDPTKRVYKNIDMTTGDTEFVTYWLDLSNTNWVGTMDDIKIHFKNAGNTDYVLPINPDNAVIDIDKIQFVDALPTSLKEVFTFDSDNDTEGFVHLNGTISGPVSGILTFTPTATKYAKIEQLSFHVDASVNKHLHITLKNNSPANNQLRFFSADLGNRSLEMSVSDATEKTYHFDFSGEANWTGDQTFNIGIGTIGPGTATDAGTVEINSIVFDNLASVNETFEALGFSLYPNPVNNQFTINGPEAIVQVQVADLMGRTLIVDNQNTIDTNKLNSGIYVVRIELANGAVATKKIIKK